VNASTVIALAVSLLAAAGAFLTHRYSRRARAAESALAERTQSADSLRDALIEVDSQRAEVASTARERARLIEELERAQARLSEQLAFTLAVTDSSADGLYTVDRDGLLTSMNRAAEQLLGWPLDEVKGTDFGKRLCAQGPEYSAGWIPPGRRALNARATVRVEEARFRRRDGSILDVSFSAAPLWIDEAMHGAVVTFRDITEHKRAQLMLMERDRFFGLSAELFCISDTSGRLRQVNSAFTRVLGFPEGELIGKSWFELVHPEDEEITRAERLQLVQHRQGTPEFRNRLRTAADAYRWLEWTSTLAPDGLIYAVARDVTERKQAQAELERAFADLRLRNEELQSFAFVASHDLQEPLRKIQAFGDRLRAKYADALGEQGQDYLERMEGAASRMQALINDLLDYSRVSTRGRPFAAVDLAAVARGVLSDLETAIDEANATVVVAPLPTLEADASQMRQLLQNLIGNALKFRAPGRDPVVHVDADVHTTEPRVRLTVRDNGIGFDMKYRERIFVPFQRLHGRSQYEGSGVGLAIVRKIVERHRGAIDADGRPGEGATFRIELPLKHPP
jgi:PAS domain S-box-containing protein